MARKVGALGRGGDARARVQQVAKYLAARGAAQELCWRGLRSWDFLLRAVNCEGKGARAPSLLVWSQTRCRCAISPLRTAVPMTSASYGLQLHLAGASAGATLPSAAARRRCAAQRNFVERELRRSGPRPRAGARKQKRELARGGAEARSCLRARRVLTCSRGLADEAPPC